VVLWEDELVLPLRRRARRYLLRSGSLCSGPVVKLGKLERLEDLGRLDSDYSLLVEEPQALPEGLRFLKYGSKGP